MLGFETIQNAENTRLKPVNYLLKCRDSLLYFQRFVETRDRQSLPDWRKWNVNKRLIYRGHSVTCHSVNKYQMNGKYRRIYIYI